jgi:hypothetical protein
MHMPPAGTKANTKPAWSDAAPQNVLCMQFIISD